MRQPWERERQGPYPISAKEFLARIVLLFGGKRLYEMNDDEVGRALDLASYASDLALNEAERRGLIGTFEGDPVIPTDMPDDLDVIPTVLSDLPRETEAMRRARFRKEDEILDGSKPNPKAEP